MKLIAALSSIIHILKISDQIFENKELEHGKRVYYGCGNAGKRGGLFNRIMQQIAEMY